MTLLRTYLSRAYRTPGSQNNGYESLFTELQDQRPFLWTAQGPREYVVADGLMSRIKWRIIKHWTRERPSSTPTTTTNRPSETAEDVGTTARVKRYFIKRWAPQIRVREGGDSLPHQSDSSNASDDLELGPILTVEAGVFTAQAIADKGGSRVEVGGGNGRGKVGEEYKMRRLFAPGITELRLQGDGEGPATHPRPKEPILLSEMNAQAAEVPEGPEGGTIVGGPVVMVEEEAEGDGVMDGAVEGREGGVRADGVPGPSASAGGAGGGHMRRSGRDFMARHGYRERMPSFPMSVRGERKRRYE